MIDFAGVKKLYVAGIELKQLLINGIQAWKGGYTNLLSRATDMDRVTIYNGVGYKSGVRLSSSSGGIVSMNGMCASGFIPAQVGDVVRISGVTHKTGTASYIMAFNSANTKTGVFEWSSLGESYTRTLDSATFGSGFDAIRICAGVINENTIVTINEEIT